MFCQVLYQDTFSEVCWLYVTSLVGGLLSTQAIAGTFDILLKVFNLAFILK